MLLPLQLILVASDLGQPVPYETMQPLQVALDDIDDNEPLFVRPPVSSHPPLHLSRPHRGSLPASTHVYTLPPAPFTVYTGCPWKPAYTSGNKYLLSNYYFKALPSCQKKQTKMPDSWSHILLTARMVPEKPDNQLCCAKPRLSPHRDSDSDLAGFPSCVHMAWEVPWGLSVNAYMQVHTTECGPLFKRPFRRWGTSENGQTPALPS